MSYSKFKKKDLGQLGQLIVKVRYITLLYVYDLNIRAKSIKMCQTFFLLKMQFFSCPVGGRNIMASGCAQGSGGR